MGRENVKTVIIPTVLDKKILEYCQKYGLSRSEFIRNCVIQKLELEKGSSNE